MGSSLNKPRESHHTIHWAQINAIYDLICIELITVEKDEGSCKTFLPQICQMKLGQKNVICHNGNVQLFGHQARMLCLTGGIFCAPPQTILSTAHVVRLQGLFSSVGPGMLVKEEMLEGNLIYCVRQLRLGWVFIFKASSDLNPKVNS